jgi:AcrR family transcriptional regulator
MEERPTISEGAPSRRYPRLRPGPGLSREKVASHQRARLQRAIVELVASDGYQALTLRGLARRARISSGTFYSHYRSTDDCLLSTYDLICRRTAERMMEAGQDEQDPRRRLTLGIDRLLQDIADAPQVATFVLRAAPAAGPAFTSTLRSSGMQVGVALEHSLRPVDGPNLPPLLLEGVVAGLARIGRVRVPSIEEDQITGVAAEAAAWTMSACGPSDQGSAFTSAPTPRDRGNRRSVPGRLQDGGWAGTLGDDRAMIVAAAFRIAKSGYHQLSVPRVCREAGVSRRDFNRHFIGLEDCFSSALELRVARALVAWERSRPESMTWRGAVHRASEMLRGAVGGDVGDARLLLVETSAAGTTGIDSRDHLITEIARTLRDTAPEGRKPSELEAEASTAAAWAILGSRMSSRTT